MSRMYMILLLATLGLFGWIQWTGWGLANSDRVPDPNIRSAPTYSSGGSYSSGGGSYRGGGGGYTGK